MTTKFSDMKKPEVFAAQLERVVADTDYASIKDVRDLFITTYACPAEEVARMEAADAARTPAQRRHYGPIIRYAVQLSYTDASGAVRLRFDLSYHKTESAMKAQEKKFIAMLLKLQAAAQEVDDVKNAAAARLAQRPKHTNLVLSWSVSRGRDSYGYNICRLDDQSLGERFTCMGGGYDMVGSVFAQWLIANYQPELLAIKDRAHNQFLLAGREFSKSDGSLYGMTYHEKGERVHIDGACGLDSVLHIAKAIGLEVERTYIHAGRRRGETTGWFITSPSAN